MPQSTRQLQATESAPSTPRSVHAAQGNIQSPGALPAAVQSAPCCAGLLQRKATGRICLLDAGGALHSAKRPHLPISMHW
jgi:hypothetical protein